jgi:hypothetical protein
MNINGPEPVRAFDPQNLRLRDVVVLVPLILGILCVLIAFAFVVRGDAYIRWGGLAVNSAVLFVFLLHRSRLYLKEGSFWKLVACFLALHLAAWIVVLIVVAEWKLAGFGSMALEAPLFLYLRARITTGKISSGLPPTRQLRRRY